MRKYSRLSGRLDVAGAPQVLFARVPELRRLSGPLIADSSLLDGEGLLLVVVDVHRGSAAGLDDVLDYDEVEGWVRDTLVALLLRDGGNR